MPRHKVTGDRPVLEVIVSRPDESLGGTYKFLIDTGGTTHVTPRVIKDLSLTPQQRVLSTSSTGRESKQTYSVGVEIPSLGRWPALALSFEPASPIDGLLGQDILKVLVFHWDGPSGWFSLDRAS
jgi:predicted aspartyl protease